MHNDRASTQVVPEAMPEDEPFPILDYLQLLWFRRRLIIALTILVAILGYIHVNQLQSIYTAQSSMMIGVTEKPMDLNEYIYSRVYGMETVEEIEVLKSRGLAEKVIQRLNLLNTPEFNPGLRKHEESLFSFLRYLNPLTWIPSSWKSAVSSAQTGELVVQEPDPEEVERRSMVTAVNIFLGKLTVNSVEFSDVLSISFNSPDPRMAQRLANTLPEVYIIDKLEAKLESTERVTGWLSEQLEELEQNVRDSEQAVEMYREQYGLTQVAGSGLLEEQLSSINSQLIIARAERAEAEARLAQVNRLLTVNEQGIETASEVLSSPLIQQLRSQEATVQRRLSELSVEYGPKHPRILQVNAELEDVRARIGEEIQKIVIGLENEVEVARTRESSLEASLEEAQSQTGVQNREAVQLRALEREAAANRALFETFLTRFKETSTTQGTETADARILSRAEIPGSPSFPNRQRTLMIIIIMGFLGACGLVFGLHLMNPGIFSPEQVEQELNLHAIGLIPKAPGKEAPHEHVLKSNSSGFIEAINSLKISLQLSSPDEPIKSLQVTSSVPEEGKTSLVITLATVLAKSGNKVVVVDGDLRRSSIESKLGLSGEGPGLTDFVISQSDDVSEFLVHHEPTQVDFMRTGDAHYASASDLFSSRRMQHIIKLLEDKYDYVLVDAPPIMAVADARVIGQVVDKTLFVVRWDKTPKKVARAAIEQLHKANVDLAGAVLQQVDLKRFGRLGYGDSGYYYHYSRYGQYYS